jgi:adhesin/invasin
VSPSQINFQMPTGALAGPVSVAVTNRAETGRYAREGSSADKTLTGVDPGLFVTAGFRAAALNGDLSVHTAATPIPAGGYVILYVTGYGPVTPPVPDGTPAPGSPLSTINAPVQVIIGGKSAQVTYQGLTPGLAGLGQLNVVVPAGLAPGDQPVFVVINGVSSNTGLITVK